MIIYLIQRNTQMLRYQSVFFFWWDITLRLKKQVTDVNFTYPKTVHCFVNRKKLYLKNVFQFSLFQISITHYQNLGSYKWKGKFFLIFLLFLKLWMKRPLAHEREDAVLTAAECCCVGKRLQSSAWLQECVGVYVISSIF